MSLYIFNSHIKERFKHNFITLIFNLQKSILKLVTQHLTF